MAAWALGDAAAAATSVARSRLRCRGAQLYTVRHELARDFNGTLRRVARLGFREVEFAGYHGRSPADVARALRAVGLESPSTHLDPAQWERDIGPAIDAALTIGHRYLVVGWVPQEHWRDGPGWRRRAEALNHAGERCRRSGLQLCYHHHHFEFVPIDGVKPFDLLLEATDPALLQFELDLFWAVAAVLQSGRKEFFRTSDYHVS
jgi:sugar phosphate isomerase/epimerase